ncbi:MAG: hypothetical protein JXB48_05240, partial [Candidatus Latescibacteria bacterium]|nr:hypothetical protein [Candidatus Latescibacterota bacterium]
MTKQSPNNTQNKYGMSQAIKKFCLTIFSIMSAFLCISTAPSADIRLPSVFSSDMVLQRDSEITVFGWADFGEKVTVSFNERNISAVTGNNGKWHVTLGTFKAGGP